MLENVSNIHLDILYILKTLHKAREIQKLNK